MMDDKYSEHVAVKRREFSEGALKIFLKHYPHLTEDEANLILSHGIIQHEPIVNVYGGSNPLIKQLLPKLYSDQFIVNEFDIDPIIDLIPDKNDVIYYEYT